MTTILREVAMTDQDPCDKDIELSQTIESLLEEVLKETNKKLNNNTISILIESLKQIIDYKNTTDENVKDYFKLLLSIIK